MDKLSIPLYHSQLCAQRLPLPFASFVWVFFCIFFRRLLAPLDILSSPLCVLDLIPSPFHVLLVFSMHSWWRQSDPSPAQLVAAVRPPLPGPQATCRQISDRYGNTLSLGCLPPHQDKLGHSHPSTTSSPAEATPNPPRSHPTLMPEVSLQWERAADQW